MADITNLFKATVKTVKAQRKAQGQSLGPDKSILGPGGKMHVKGEFEIKSKEVVSNITELREFLMKHRKDYVNTFSHLGREISKMSDAERDQIDTDTEMYIKLCSESIKTLKEQAAPNKTAAQVKDHRGSVLSLIEAYLKGVCKSYSEQRAVRVKRVVDRKRISRLEPENKKPRSSGASTPYSEPGGDNSNDHKAEETKSKNAFMSKTALEGSRQPDPEEELSAEELQMFQLENEQLYEEMNSMVDEVKQVEGKVVEISQLQEIFAEKVLSQDADIDRIANTVVGTTENIKDANEEIREAMKNNAGLRVWILFFLIVCTFSLLFLDWYNP